jgi:hypothetical protein
LACLSFIIADALKQVVKNPGVTIAFITFAVLLLLSESLKIFSVVSWCKKRTVV